MDLDEDMEWDSKIMYMAFGIVGGLIVFFSICCSCCNRHRRLSKSATSIHSTNSNHSDQCAQSNDDAGNVFKKIVLHLMATGSSNLTIKREISLV